MNKMLLKKVFLTFEIVTMLGASGMFFLSVIMRDNNMKPVTTAGNTIDVILGCWFLVALGFFLFATKGQLWSVKK